MWRGGTALRRKRATYPLRYSTRGSNGHFDVRRLPLHPGLKRAERERERETKGAPKSVGVFGGGVKYWALAGDRGGNAMATITSRSRQGHERRT